MRDRIDYVQLQDFVNAYLQIKNPLLCSKTKENSFQTLNRTIWTNNKAFKSRTRETPDCPYCGDVETMEHLYFGCKMYSELQWMDLGKYITQYIRQTTDPDCSEIRITYRNIIFNEEIKNIHRKLPSKNIRKFLQLLIHELRRDIYFRKINHVPNNFEEVMGIRRKAHLKSVLEKIISYLEYIGLAKWSKTIECARKIKENILNDL